MRFISTSVDFIKPKIITVLFTADECGQYSLTRGYYDYCLYLDSARPDFLGMTWEEKTSTIMEQVTAEESLGKYPYENLDGN